MITREQAWKLLTDNMQSQNLRRHCLSVEAVMCALAKRLGGDTEKWGIVGLLHDGDYEKTKETPEKHAKLAAGWVKDLGETDEELLTGIESHGWFHIGKLPETKMQSALYCCDELTGLIVAVALVKPDKKLASVTVDSIKNKWREKSFAAGVDRNQIEKCDEMLGIPLDEFLETTLSAMQAIAPELGL
ncbi:HDIG domain-containing protein [Candidatus Woesebacteria bacterium]|nr:HDIG domain-containing protein [Candidatus Woesebacteria bacterium]